MMIATHKEFAQKLSVLEQRYYEADEEVALLVAEVFQLVRPLSDLMQEPLLGRVTRRLAAL